MRYCAVLLIMAIFLFSQLAYAQEFSPGFPRVAMHTQHPYENNTYLDRAAKGDVIMVNGYIRISNLQYLKNRNPSIKIISVIGSFCGIPLDKSEDPESFMEYSKCDTEPAYHERWFFDCELYKWLEENDGWLYRTDGQHYIGWVSADGTKLNMFCMAEGCPARDSQGRNLTEFYSDLVDYMIFQNGFGYAEVDIWDGVMWDCAEDMSWTIDLFNNGIRPDFNRDHNSDNFYPNMRIEEEKFFSSLRQYAGTEHAVFVNGVHWVRETLNGYQIENLLHRGGWICNNNEECEWQTDMFGNTPGYGDKHGYLAVEGDYLTEPFRVGMLHIGWCYGNEVGPLPRSQSEADLIEFNRYKRFAIGTVALGDGYLTFNWNDPSCGKGHTEAWPLPENYNGLPGTPHYLGQALGPCKVVEDNYVLSECRELQPGSIKVYRRDFENGIVLVNPSYQTKSVKLEKSYKVLDVIEHFTVPGGTVLDNVTLRPFDAVILLDTQGTIPICTRGALVTEECYCNFEIVEPDGENFCCQGESGIYLFDPCDNDAECSDGNTTTADMCVNPLTCNAYCFYIAEQNTTSQCINNDGICPVNCTIINDNDCIPTIQCANNDGICPENCTIINDNDCPYNCTDSDNDFFYRLTAYCSSGDDCDDNNASINPIREEICGNNVDENCDGADMQCVECPIEGQQTDCIKNDCAGLMTCTNGYWTSCVKNNICCGINCDDNIVCTVDSCSNGLCSHEQVINCVQHITNYTINLPKEVSDGEPFIVNITDEYGKPLQGVVVTYNDITKYTDNFGYAYFTAKSGKTHIEVSYKNVVKTAELDSINLKDDL